MALYAFDGTGNEDNEEDGKDTNVRKFFEAHNHGPNGSARDFYVPGVGTRHSWLGAIFGGLFGAGGHERVNEGMERLEANFRDGDTVIDIIGFSRGAALALESPMKFAMTVSMTRKRQQFVFLGFGIRLRPSAFPETEPTSAMSLPFRRTSRFAATPWRWMSGALRFP